MRLKIFFASATLATAIFAGEKLYLLNVSPEEAKELPRSELAKIVSSKDYYDVESNRDILGKIVGKTTIDEEDVKRASLGGGKDKIYLGGRYYIPAGSSDSGDENERGIEEVSVASVGNGGMKRIRRIETLLRKAKMEAALLKIRHFDKRYLIRDINSILRGLEGFDGGR